jgi:hypothetical protein
MARRSAKKQICIIERVVNVKTPRAAPGRVLKKSVLDFFGSGWPMRGFAHPPESFTSRCFVHASARLPGALRMFFNNLLTTAAVPDRPEAPGRDAPGRGART